MKPAFLIGRIIFGGFFLQSGIDHLKEHEKLASYAGSKGIPSPDEAVHCIRHSARARWSKYHHRLHRTISMKAITILSLLIAITPTSIVFGQETPAAPPEITPPAGNVAFLTAHAVGTQNYICLPPATDAGSANTWTFLAPQATLSVKLGRFVQQVATHFLSAVPTDSPTAQPACTLSADGKQLYCPTWQSSFDSSAVWGSKAGSINAGTDASCPNAGSIPCLLLKVVATKPGTFGTGLFARTTYVQRLHTKGGSAPTTSCQIGALQFIPYTADYTFYTTDDQHDDVQNQR